MLNGHCLARGSLNSLIDHAKTATAKLLQHLVMTGNIVASHRGELMLIAHGHCQTVWAAWGRRSESRVKWSEWMGPWADSSNVEAQVQRCHQRARCLAMQLITPGNILNDDERESTATNQQQIRMPEKQTMKKAQVSCSNGCGLFVTSMAGLGGFTGWGWPGDLGVELGPAGPAGPGPGGALVLANQMSVERWTLALDLGVWR